MTKRTATIEFVSNCYHCHRVKVCQVRQVMDAYSSYISRPFCKDCARTLNLVWC